MVLDDLTRILHFEIARYVGCTGFGPTGQCPPANFKGSAYAKPRNLKKQAKQYLRWHRERYYPVAAQIRAALPRFQHLDDTQILESNFKLNDAQELVARQLGFEGWQALKSGAHSMTTQSRQTAPRPILSSTSAQLFVSDVKASCDFFADKLGFAIDFVYGDPPYRR